MWNATPAVSSRTKPVGVATETTGTRSVTSITSVPGQDRLTSTEATGARAPTRAATASVSTRASGVPSGTAATDRTWPVSTMVAPLTAICRTPSTDVP